MESVLLGDVTRGAAPSKKWAWAAIALSAVFCIAGVVFFSVRSNESWDQSPDEPPPPPPNTLTFIHFNDLYQIDPVESGGIEGGLGGFARFKTVLDAERAKSPERTLLFFAGDLISPSTLSSLFLGAQMTSLMNLLAVDAATIGNHEFDLGKELFEQRVGESAFPWISSNLADASTGTAFLGMASPFVRTVPFVDSAGAAAEAKVCAFGVSYDIRNSISEANGAELAYTDYLDSAKERALDLRANGCAVVVALTHLDQRDDCLLADQADVDVVLGGHDHETTLVTSCGAPIFKAASDLKSVWTLQLRLNDDGTLATDAFAAESIQLGREVPEDPLVAVEVARWNELAEAELGQVLGCTAVPLDARRLVVRGEESNVGNFFTDAMRARFGVDVGLWNGGGIRGDAVVPVGNLSKRDASELSPFGNKVVTVTCTGAEVRLYLEESLACYEDLCGDFPQVGGIRYSFDPTQPALARLRSFELANGTAVEDEQRLTVATSDFVYGLSALKECPLFGMNAPSDALPLMEYTLYPAIKAAGAGCISPVNDGRITKLVL